MEYQSAPIYSILKKPEHQTAKNVLQDYINNGLNKRATECVKNQCSSAGTCISDPAFFQNALTANMPYTDLFMRGECICNQDKTGAKCDKKVDITKVVAANRKDNKILAWSTMSVSDSSIAVEEIKDYYKPHYLKIFLNKDHENWLIFSSAYFNQEFRQAISRFGQKVIAVQKNLAYQSKVVVPPTTYRVDKKFSEIYYRSICPAGYKQVSNAVLRADKDQKSNIELWQKGSVHCLNQKYQLKEGAATKYGYDLKVSRDEVYGYTNHWTRKYYPTSIKNFKFNSSNAKFDLGQTGAIYYPSFFEPENKMVRPVIIDFGHEDFFFTEEQKKKLSEIKK